MSPCSCNYSEANRQHAGTPAKLYYAFSCSALSFSVVAVPGFGTPPVKNWGVRSELETAADAVDYMSHVHMYTHEPAYRPGEKFTWESFLKRGSDLAEDLARLSEEVGHLLVSTAKTKRACLSSLVLTGRHNRQFPNRPIILVAHSLGGVLLKKVGAPGAPTLDDLN